MLSGRVHEWLLVARDGHVTGPRRGWAEHVAGGGAVVVVVVSLVDEDYIVAAVADQRLLAL